MAGWILGESITIPWDKKEEVARLIDDLGIGELFEVEEDGDESCSTVTQKSWSHQSDVEKMDAFLTAIAVLLKNTEQDGQTIAYEVEDSWSGTVVIAGGCVRDLAGIVAPMVVKCDASVGEVKTIEAQVEVIGIHGGMGVIQKVVT